MIWLPSRQMPVHKSLHMAWSNLFLMLADFSLWSRRGNLLPTITPKFSKNNSSLQNIMNPNNCHHFFILVSFKLYNIIFFLNCFYILFILNLALVAVIRCFKIPKVIVLWIVLVALLRKKWSLWRLFCLLWKNHIS